MELALLRGLGHLLQLLGACQVGELGGVSGTRRQDRQTSQLPRVPWVPLKCNIGMFGKARDGARILEGMAHWGTLQAFDRLGGADTPQHSRLHWTAWATV